MLQGRGEREKRKYTSSHSFLCHFALCVPCERRRPSQGRASHSSSCPSTFSRPSVRAGGSLSRGMLMSAQCAVPWMKTAGKFGMLEVMPSACHLHGRRRRVGNRPKNHNGDERRSTAKGTAAWPTSSACVHRRVDRAVAEDDARAVGVVAAVELNEAMGRAEERKPMHCQYCESWTRTL